VLPGATLEESDGATYRGRVKVRPILRAHRGEVAIAEQEEGARRLVLVASGREARGSGAASARVVADLVDRSESTDVRVVTELDLTGEPAQFATSLAALMLAPPAPPAGAAPLDVPAVFLEGFGVLTGRRTR
jgi:carbon monoxide dehydrogenase subunit G